MLEIIVAVGNYIVDKGYPIGKDNKLPWKNSNDLKWFRQNTEGNIVIMGRKTFESLPKGALPNRRNVVVTRQEDYAAPNIEVFHSFEEALKACETDEKVFVLGGESLYAIALPLATELQLTHIHAAAPEADTWFPAFEAGDWKKTAETSFEPDEKNKQRFSFCTYERQPQRM